MPTIPKDSKSQQDIQGSIDISMTYISTMRTSEFVTLAVSKKTTLGTQLAGIGRLDKSNSDSLPFSPISYCRCHQPIKPTVQLPASSFSDTIILFGLGFKIQILKNKYRILRNPLAEFSGGFLAECPVSILMFMGKPFQHSTDTPRVPVLCLLPDEFGLQTRTNLARLGVADRQSLATDKERLLVGGSNKGVVHPEVNAYGNNALGFGSLDGDAEESLAPSNPKTVNTLGSVKVLAEVFGNTPADFLSSLQSGDGQASVSSERKVFGIKEKGRRSTEDERTICWFAVGLGRSISSGSCSDGVAAHLGSQGSRSLVVDQLLQFKGAKWSSAVEADRTQNLLVAVELRHGIVNKGVLVKDYRYGSLDVHTSSIVTHPEKRKT